MDTVTALIIFRKQLEKYVIFDEAEWAAFKDHVNFKALKKKKHFAEPGTVCNEFGFIVSGSVRYYHVKDGEEITGYFSFENECKFLQKLFNPNSRIKLYSGARRHYAGNHQL